MTRTTRSRTLFAIAAFTAAFSRSRARTRSFLSAFRSSACPQEIDIDFSSEKGFTRNP